LKQCASARAKAIWGVIEPRLLKIMRTPVMHYEFARRQRVHDEFDLQGSRFR
jgi:hypothetical protein